MSAPEYPEKKRAFASRIREDTWKMLQEAAAASGRSVSQEFEHRLRLGSMTTNGTKRLSEIAERSE
jgi:hypothetical protein